MPKENLRDKIDGNDLDLSLNNLESVPVKELMALPKATHLDLSCNVLVTLPVEFCKLSHLVRLDLSKNRLTSLPVNFGSLAKLQYLDLFQNELTTLPVSICRLGKLKWLDVKDNPIHETVKSVAGDCLNEEQCKACAKNIVAFMKKAEDQQERERQMKLQQERELEKKRKAAEEREKERIRAKRKQEKEQEKERRRKLHEEKMRLERDQQDQGTGPTHQNGGAHKTDENVRVLKGEKSGLPCCGVFLAFIIGLAAVLCGLYVYCANNQSDRFCQQSELLARQYFAQIDSTVRFYVLKVQEFMKTYSNS